MCGTFYQKRLEQLHMFYVLKNSLYSYDLSKFIKCCSCFSLLSLDTYCYLLTHANCSLSVSNSMCHFVRYIFDVCNFNCCLLGHTLHVNLYVPNSSILYLCVYIMCNICFMVSVK